MTSPVLLALLIAPAVFSLLLALLLGWLYFRSLTTHPPVK